MQSPALQTSTMPSSAVSSPTTETSIQKSPALHDAANVVELPGLADSRRTHHFGILILLLGLGGFLLWAAFAPLDEGVPTEGVVNVEGNHKVVQHLTGGIVSQIFVTEGQEVATGDLLFRLDDTATRARFNEVRQRYLGLRAEESRLLAEKSGTDTIAFHQDLLQNRHEPYVQQLILNQTQLMHARRQLLTADIAAMRESIQGEMALIDGYQGMLISYQSQLGLLQDQLAGIRQLVLERLVLLGVGLHCQSHLGQLGIDLLALGLLPRRDALVEFEDGFPAAQDIGLGTRDLAVGLRQLLFQLVLLVARRKAFADELPDTGQLVLQ